VLSCSKDDEAPPGHGGWETDASAGASGDSGPGGSAGTAGTDAGQAGSAGSADSGVCVAKTCTDLGATCGSALDGCGGKVTCGICPAGQKCGGDGLNKCGTNDCSPKSCAQIGVSCGLASDGCSEAIDCGKCAAPDTCGGAGVPGQCGCTPKSCAKLGVSCGTVADGCGTTDCGGCGEGETCGGGGVPGQCGCTCTPPHSTSTCAAGVCTILACESDWEDCDNEVGNGCESHVPDDPEHCGSCAKECSFAHADATCESGVCAMGGCEPGWTDCDAKAPNGCEINTDADPVNCGSCGKTCGAAGGTPKCWGGVCGIDCSTGLGDCNGSVADGCETNLTKDLHHCGSCTKDCATPLPTAVATAKCVSSACAVATCNSSKYDQNATFKDGCECTADSHPNTCETAKEVHTAAIAVGGSVQVTGNLTPAGDQDWFVASFAGNKTCSFHPRAQLTDASGLLRIVVQSACATHLSCSEGGTSTSATTWEFTYKGTCGTHKPVDPGQKASAPTTVRVGVFSTGPSKTCLPYTLTISN